MQRKRGLIYGLAQTSKNGYLFIDTTVYLSIVIWLFTSEAFVATTPFLDRLLYIWFF